jgi:hypothetical protein
MDYIPHGVDVSSPAAKHRALWAVLIYFEQGLGGGDKPEQGFSYQRFHCDVG